MQRYSPAPELFSKSTLVHNIMKKTIKRKLYFHAPLISDDGEPLARVREWKINLPQFICRQFVALLNASTFV